MIGQTVGHYRIISKLGQGGMGEVYLAEDTRLDRKAAIKLLPVEWASDAERRRRFFKEAKAASALNHPHVCVIYDVGETDDLLPFFCWWSISSRNSFASKTRGKRNRKLPMSTSACYSRPLPRRTCRFTSC